MARFNNGGYSNKNNKDGDSNIPDKRESFEIVEPRCNICKSKWRRTVDQLLAIGVPYAEIARQFETEGFNRKSIANHRERHLSIEGAVVRQILEEKSKQMGEDIENGKKIILTRKGVLEVALMKGYQGVISGDTVVEPREMIGIVQQLEKMDETSSAAQVEELNLQFNAFLDSVKKIAPQSIWDQIVSEFEKQLGMRSEIINSYAVELPDIGDIPTDFKGYIDGSS